MATKKEIIDDAYAEIGLAGYTFDLSAEEYSYALRRLDWMAAMWDSQGIRVGYNLPASARASDLGDDAGIPDWALQGFVTNLAVTRLASMKGKTVPPQLAQVADDSYQALLTGSFEIPQMQMPRHMPIGTGNRRNTKNQQFFAPVDRITTTDDDLLQPTGNPWPDSN
ncbi:hypothetical protein PIN31009_05546 [Pandoraea iniqua]|uniref:packaged DNA stabilization gp4 family protein n=1 Tax=Pandoraea iniqua TaxID=2508288 RepID=UPI00123F68D8|nr:packaged DNA stabilization gp4 family protein [Pandoraea iniqua]VVE59465.1 hypothetical protein PIN31009_05546 [Pandoraea iniqua]